MLRGMLRNCQSRPKRLGLYICGLCICFAVGVYSYRCPAVSHASLYACFRTRHFIHARLVRTQRLRNHARRSILPESKVSTTQFISALFRQQARCLQGLSYPTPILVRLSIILTTLSWV